MISFSAFDFCQKNSDYVTLPFFYGGKPASETFRDVDIPTCVMSLASAGSLRYNSGLKNPARQKFLDEVLPRGVVSVPVYLVHSKTVFVAEDVSCSGRGSSSCGSDSAAGGSSGGVCDANGLTDVQIGSCGENDDDVRLVSSGDVRLLEPETGAAFRPGAEGDGIITSCRSFAPVVTAADCMPVFLWDSRTGAFGICHSGWKGTGIAAKAVALMCARFGAKTEDICVILGPHIHECCYTVDAERAEYFCREFSPDCCTPVDGGGCAASSGGQSAPNPSNVVPAKYRLSLARANVVSLTNAGIKPENIFHCTDCTSCFSLPGVPGAPCVGNATGAKEAATDASAATQDARFFPYGSFRRQTAHLPEGTPLEERFKVFSAMAAVIGYIAHK